MGIKRRSRRLTVTTTLGAIAVAVSLSGCAASSSAPAATTPATATTTTAPAPITSAATPTNAPASATVAIPAAPTAPLAAAAWEALLGPEGEYAASASYAAVIQAFGPVEPYVTIQAAEERHIDALTRQLQRLGVTPPPNPYLGTVAAPTSLAAAAQAWADGEVANVALYDKLVAQAAGDQGLTRVFTNLRRASAEMHLPAFQAAAAAGGTLSAAQMTELGLH